MKRIITLVTCIAIYGIGVLLLYAFISSVSGDSRMTLYAAQPQAGTGHSVALTCTPGVTDASHDSAASFNFKRSATTGGPYTTIGNSPSCTFNDTSVSAGQRWFYVATGVNIAGESGQSNEVSVTVATFPPAAPTALVGVAK